MPNNNGEITELILAAINDAQGTIRAFDIKAQILAALLALGIGLVNYGTIHALSSPISWIVAAATLVGLTAIAFIGVVLQPGKSPEKEIKLGGYIPGDIFYISQDILNSNVSVSDHAKALQDVDIRSELSYELFKLSWIRNQKAKWFSISMISTYVFIILSFIFVLMRICL